ncbi:hypothetical protein [Photobacterium halotolerans]|uniref:hypothetical protein n=1 Tax=Photobacterium halotolerans TaxID=265726 RepID=UPI0004815232|nr:hypothetical protein [Photobacterium halotolerans]
MSDFIKNSIIGPLVIALILSAIGYVFIIKENNMRIAILEKKLDDQVKVYEKLNDNLRLGFNNVNNSLGGYSNEFHRMSLLFAKYHPDSTDVLFKTSISKLNDLSNTEVKIIADTVAIRESGLIAQPEKAKKAIEIMNENNINEEDMNAFVEVMGLHK